jgi:hypothetical protein
VQDSGCAELCINVKVNHVIAWDGKGRDIRSRIYLQRLLIAVTQEVKDCLLSSEGTR